MAKPETQMKVDWITTETHLESEEVKKQWEYKKNTKSPFFFFFMILRRCQKMTSNVLTAEFILPKAINTDLILSLLLDDEKRSRRFRLDILRQFIYGRKQWESAWI